MMKCKICGRPMEYDICCVCRNVPTPEEIRERCKIIQDNWSKRQEQKRLVAYPTRWDVPDVSMGEINYETGEVSRESYYN